MYEYVICMHEKQITFCRFWLSLFCFHNLVENVVCVHVVFFTPSLLLTRKLYLKLNYEAVFLLHKVVQIIRIISNQNIQTK